MLSQNSSNRHANRRRQIETNISNFIGAEKKLRKSQPAFMPPRLPSQGFSSFIAFYSCSRLKTGSSTRSYSVYRSQCLQSQVCRSSGHKFTRVRRVGDKVLAQPCACIANSYSLEHQRLLHATLPLGNTPKDPYKVLGVKPDATAAEIKKTYFSVRSGRLSEPIRYFLHPPFLAGSKVSPRYKS